jgi:hypothetical protein
MSLPPNLPHLGHWRAVVPDVNPEEIAALRRINVVEPRDLFSAEEVVAAFRLGAEMGVASVDTDRE